MEHIKDIIRNELQSEDLIKLCILYGSAASGRITDRSDIDIAVAGKEKLEIEYIADLQIKLSLKLGYETDLIDMNSAEGLILKEIMKGGIVLIKKDTGLYADLIKKVMYFDADILPNIKMILKKRAEKFARGY
jgi:uncharacterized protein